MSPHFTLPCRPYIPVWEVHLLCLLRVGFLNSLLAGRSPTIVGDSHACLHTLFLYIKHVCYYIGPSGSYFHPLWKW